METPNHTNSSQIITTTTTTTAPESANAVRVACEPSAPLSTPKRCEQNPTKQAQQPTRAQSPSDIVGIERCSEFAAHLCRKVVAAIRVHYRQSRAKVSVCGACMEISISGLPCIFFEQLSPDHWNLPPSELACVTSCECKHRNGDPETCDVIVNAFDGSDFTDERVREVCASNAVVAWSPRNAMGDTVQAVICDACEVSAPESEELARHGTKAYELANAIVRAVVSNALFRSVCTAKVCPPQSRPQKQDTGAGYSEWRYAHAFIVAVYGINTIGVRTLNPRCWAGSTLDQRVLGWLGARYVAAGQLVRVAVTNGALEEYARENQEHGEKRYLDITQQFLPEKVTKQ